MASNDFRLGYSSCRDLLRERLREAAPRRIQLLTGPRQVGKTTLLLELADELGPRAVYTAADGPGATLPGYWDRVWAEAEGRPDAVVLIDEVQHLSDWASLLKGEWDRLRRRRTRIHVIATGSSALGLARGSRESLAGRFERLTLTHWSAAEMAATFGLSTEAAVDLFIRRGSYPGAADLVDDPPRWTAYLRDAIVEPAIGRDILALADVRKPALLRQVFALAASCPAQIVSLQKLQGQLQDRGALETISHYLGLLEDAYLVAALPKFTTRPIRRRASPPKLVPLSNALCAAVDHSGSPDPEADPARYGRWVENACLAYAWNCGQRVSYWREEPVEVDGVIEGSWGRIAIEVKTGTVETADLKGLLEFTRRNPDFRPLLLCGPSGLRVAKRLGVPAMEYRRFLSEGP
jgi:predicted AAA+ superfamily ATPase